MTGKIEKQAKNENKRANGIEPKPSAYAGIRKWARYIKRTTKQERKNA